MMILQPVLLGVVEGVTEFLPVSSTGHLVLAGALLGFDQARWAMFDVVIQLGAIMAVVVLYWRTFWAVAAGCLKGTPGAWAFVRNVVLAFVPAAVIGLAFHHQIEALLLRPVVVCWALIVGGVAILAIERLASDGRVNGVAAIPATTAIGVGLIQCLSMVPGVSRSGATILGALSLGVERRTAAEFSFFLAIPTMLGASVLELAKNHDLVGAAGTAGWGEIAIGFVVSFLVAVIVVRSFVAFVSRRGFSIFGWYRIGVGILCLLLLGSR